MSANCGSATKPSRSAGLRLAPIRDGPVTASAIAACTKKGGTPVVTQGIFFDDVACDMKDGSATVTEPKVCPSGSMPVMGPGGDFDMRCKPTAAEAKAGKATGSTGGGATAKGGGGSTSKNLPASAPSKKAEPTNWPLIAGIVGIVAVGGAIVYTTMKKKSGSKKTGSKKA